VTLSDVSIQRPVLTWMMALALLVFGVLGYARLGVDQYPDMEFPQVEVIAALEGATPEGIEEDVTDVLEEHLNTISGIRTLRSSSYQGICRISVEFELGTDLDVAVQDVRDQVSAARRYLPKELEPPRVRKRRASGWPVVYVPFSSDHRPLVEVSEYVRRHVKPILETIPGAAGVVVWGRRDRNIRIWLDSDALRSRGLAANDVLAALAREHVDVPGGIVESSRIEWSVKTDAEFRSVAALEDMVVARRGEATVHLRDVARVEDGVEDVRDITRFNGVPSVVAAVTKQSDANTVAVVDEVYRRIAALRPLLPDGIHVVNDEKFVDFSISIRESVQEAKFALLFGGALAVFVVFVFLRRTRPTLIVAAAIPLSLVATFGLVWAIGYTLNTMTLLGMTLAIGVVIDDAIIVLENIERHRAMGKPGKQAASEGTRQIVFAATAATVSVAAVFLPVAFAEGIVGNFLGEFGLTVAGSVLISLFVALTVTPMLAARIPPPGAKQHGSLYHGLEVGFRALEARYRRLLHWSLDHRLATFAIALASFALAIFFGKLLPAEFFPTADGRVVFLQFKLPPGSTLEATAAMLDENERYFLAQPEVLAGFAGIGHTTGTGVGRPNRGVLFTTLVHSDDRKRTSQAIMRDAREVLGEVPGQKLNINDPTASFSSQGELQLELRGNLAVAELDRHATRLVQALKQRGGFVDLQKDLEIGLPEVRVIPDRRKAAALGVDAATLASVVQVMIGGLDVGVFKEAGKRYDIRIRLERPYRDRPEAISDLSVRASDGSVVELRNLVRVETGAAASQISRADRQRAVTIAANLEGKALGAASEEAFEIARRILPEGVTLRLAGQAEAMEESGRQLGLMLALAILVIYMVLAAQFESFFLPFTVMLALPFSMVGALGALYFAGMTLKLFSMIGIILLMGLVTKNSILLVDYANQLRAEGRDKLAAIREAAPVRMRPVLMTACSMIFGVLPAAVGVGPGAETRAPMAVATAAGMFSSMLLTLLIVPLFYVAIDDFAESCKALPSRLRRAASAPRPGGSCRPPPRRSIT
jgi:HAE1 family hydrophobic/amphiphilic exporter-1